MAAGRRTVKELVKRLKNFKERIPRFRKLKKLGVDPAMVVRTGGKASIVYGESTMGVSNSLLQSQRRSVAAAVAPQFGTGGQNLDIALMMADASAKGSADPAFDAHILVIGDWARGVWNVWTPRATLDSWVAKANKAEARQGEECMGEGQWSVDSVRRDLWSYPLDHHRRDQAQDR